MPPPPRPRDLADPVILRSLTFVCVASQQQLTETATSALAVADDAEKQRRAKKVLKMLGKPVEGDDSEDEAPASDAEAEAEAGEDAEDAEEGDVEVVGGEEDGSSEGEDDE